MDKIENGLKAEDNKAFSDPAEVRRTEFSIITEIHNQLMQRFGRYNTPSWRPTEENVSILSDEMFEKEVGPYIEKEVDASDVASNQLKQLIGYAHFETQRLYARASQDINQAVRETLAHEMLHLWFMRALTDEGDIYSYGVNETLVDTLALEGLGLFEIPKEEREPEIDNAINNSIILKGVMEKLGKEGWEAMFRVCQTGDQTKIAALTETHFGSQPAGKLSQINDSLPVLFGKSFWERLKELALMAYLIRRDPLFQSRNPAATNYQILLIAKWAKIEDRFFQEIDLK